MQDHSRTRKRSIAVSTFNCIVHLVFERNKAIMSEDKALPEWYLKGRHALNTESTTEDCENFYKGFSDVYDKVYDVGHTAE